MPATQSTFYLNLYLASGGEPVVFEYPAMSTDLAPLCESIQDAWASGTAIAIKNPAGSEYVNSAHVARFWVS